ncbi:MAG: hypothetical protein JRE63_09840 [Deltaproteobacteria bacterium]|nr:hypothetical protein [Deltaproteobacteria bacterium]
MQNSFIFLPCSGMKIDIACIQAKAEFRLWPDTTVEGNEGLDEFIEKACPPRTWDGHHILNPGTHQPALRH